MGFFLLAGISVRISINLMKLDELLSPFSWEDFTHKYWERESLYVNHEDEHFYEALISPQDIDNYLFANEQLVMTPFKFYRGKEAANPTDWTKTININEFSTTVVDHQKVLDLFRKGFSMYLNYPDKLFPKIKDFCLDLEESLRVQTISHLIISPPNAQGFLPHTDPYGVFVLQIAGSKTWNLYGTSSLPTLSYGQDLHHYTAQNLQDTKRLRAGDLLYVPRGVVHSVATENEFSIHISLGIMPPTGSNLISVLQSLAESQPFFQQYIPYGFLGEAQAQAHYEASFKKELIRLIEEADIYKILDASLLQKHALQERRKLKDLLAIKSLSLNDHIRKKPNLPYRLATNKEKGISWVEFEGKNLQFPFFWKESLEEALQLGSLQINDLGKGLKLSEAEKIQVAKNMVQSGLFEILFPGDELEA